ncbi:MAG: peptidoglycan-binding protein LysM [Acidobacteriota bacterium]
MGLFKFVKNAGKGIFGKGEDEKSIDQKEAEARQRLAAARSRRLRQNLESELKAKGVDPGDVDIQVDGDTVKLAGTVADQETKEKVVLALGNVEGIAAVDESLDVEKTEPESVFHTVERGDTLSAIAKEHYGKASLYMVIFEANKPMLSDPDKIYPGQVLRIPPHEG